MLRERGTQTQAETPAAPVVDKAPRHQRERLLRQEVERLVRLIAIRANVEFRQVSVDLMKDGFPKRSEATVEQLQDMAGVLSKWLAQT